MKKSTSKKVTKSTASKNAKGSKTQKGRAAKAAEPADVATVAADAVEATTVTETAPIAAPAATKRETATKDVKPMGILGAAVRVLEDHQNETPMNCSDMVGEMQAKGYWQPRKGGKTPANTLYSAILREINTKADASRFRKAERGKFLLNTSI